MQKGTRVLVVDTPYSDRTGTVCGFDPICDGPDWLVELDGDEGETMFFRNELQVIEEGEDQK